MTAQRENADKHMAKLVRIDEFRNARFRPKWRPAEALPVEPRGVSSAVGEPVAARLEHQIVAVIPRHPAEPSAFSPQPAQLFYYSTLCRVVACYNAAADAPFEGTVALPQLRAGTFTNETVFQSARAGLLILPDEPEPDDEPPLEEEMPTEAFTVSLFPKRATRPGVVIPRLPAAGLMYLRTRGEPQVAAGEARKEGPLEVQMAADGPIIRVNIAATGPALPDFGFMGRRAACFDVRPAFQPGMDAVGMPVHALKVPDLMAPFENGYVTPTGQPFTLADSASRVAAPCGAVTLDPPPLSPITPEVPLPTFHVKFTGPMEEMISGVEQADAPAVPMPPIFPAVKLPEGDPSFLPSTLTSRFFARGRFAVRVPPAMQLEDVSFSSAQPRLPVRLPRAPAASYRPGVVCVRAVRAEWRSISTIEAEPVRMLLKGDPLTACEYRTRSML